MKTPRVYLVIGSKVKTFPLDRYEKYKRQLTAEGYRLATDEDLKKAGILDTLVEVKPKAKKDAILKEKEQEEIKE